MHQAVVTGIARAHDGTLYVNYATGTSRTGIWRLAPGEEPEQIALLLDQRLSQRPGPRRAPGRAVRRRLGARHRLASPAAGRTGHRVVPGHRAQAADRSLGGRLRRQRPQGAPRCRVGVEHRPRHAAAHPRRPGRFRGPGRDPGARARSASTTSPSRAPAARWWPR
ncbi:hypothetical protein ACQ4WX_44910 [Streptomyces lasalocidi]